MAQYSFTQSELKQIKRKSELVFHQIFDYLIFLTNLSILAYQTKQVCLQSYRCLAVFMKYGCRFLELNSTFIIKLLASGSQILGEYIPG